MKEGVIYLSQQSWHYLDMEGDSKDYLLLFPGFGQSPLSYQKILESLFSSYRVLLFYLPYHGPNSENPNPILADELEEILLFCHKKYQPTTLSFGGNSIGARLAIALFQISTFPCKSLFLFAPDGIRTRLGFTLATRFKWGRWLFAQLCYRHNQLVSMIRILRSARLLSISLARLAESRLRNPEKAWQVYGTWQRVSMLEWKPPLFNSALNRLESKVWIFVGKFDEIIPPTKCKALKNLTKVEYSELPCGHDILNSQALRSFHLSVDK